MSTLSLQVAKAKLHEFETYQSEFSNVLSIQQQKQQTSAFNSPSKRAVEDDPDANLKPEVMAAVVRYAQLDDELPAPKSDAAASDPAASAAAPMDRDGEGPVPASIDEAMHSLLRKIDELQQIGAGDERLKADALVNSYSTRHPLLGQMLSDLIL